MELLDVLGGYKVRFWTCPLYSRHWPERGLGRYKGETVRWIDDVAHCMYPGCDIRSDSGIVLCDLCGAVGPGEVWRPGADQGGMFVCRKCKPCPTCAQRGGYCFEGDEVHCRVVEALSGTWEPSERLWLENALYRATVTQVFYALYSGVRGLDQRVRNRLGG